ncbi:MAG: signal peptidase II [bacterium]
MKWEYLLSYTGIVLLFIADRMNKYFFLENPAARRVFLFLTFSLTKNDGIAFGLPINKIFLNGIVFLLIIILLMLFLNILNISKYVNEGKISRQHLKIIVFLILLAAISNFIDRILYGAVIDYIELPHFVSLNIADIMITTGFLIISIIYFFGKIEKKVNK